MMSLNNRRFRAAITGVAAAAAMLATAISSMAAADPAQPDRAMWSDLLRTVGPKGDADYFQGALGIELAPQSEPAVFPTYSYVNYHTKVPTDRVRGADLTYQWGADGIKYFFEAWRPWPDTTAGGAPCLTLADFSDMAKADGWTDPSMYISGGDHGFKVVRDGLFLQVGAGGGGGLHMQIDQPDYHTLEDCAESVTIATEN